MNNNLNQANDDLRNALERFYYAAKEEQTPNDICGDTLTNTANFNEYSNGYARSDSGSYTLTGYTITTGSIASSNSGYNPNSITIADTTTNIPIINGSGTLTVPYNHHYHNGTINIPDPYNNVKIDPKTIERYSFKDIESIMRLMTMWIDDPAVTDKIKNMFDEWKKLEKLD